MSKISEAKKQKIKEDILSFLYENSPRALFTNEIAVSIARDEEFVLDLLKDLNSQNLVVKVTKNGQGKAFLARKRWNLSPQAYNAYKNLLGTTNL